MIRVLQIIRLKLKARYDAIDNSTFKKNFLNAVPFWVGAFVTGLIAVLYARLFAIAESGAAALLGDAQWLVFVLCPLSFFLAWWLCFRFAPFARGSGIPQVTAAIELTIPKHNYKVNTILSLRIIFIKMLSSMVMIFGGGAIGREGPTIQISASIFKLINDRLPAWYPRISRRNMIVAGAAAGLAAAFNTPLGGIVFAIEELTKIHFNYFKSALLVGVIIAGLTALNLLGPYLYLGYPDLNVVPVWMITIVIPVAIFSGIGGSGMGRLILFVFRKKSAMNSRLLQLLFPLLSGTLMAVIAFFIDRIILGSGKDLMVSLLFTHDKHLAWYVPLLRIIGPVLSFSTGAAGGIFAPALSAGASIGAVMAGWLDVPGDATNLLVLCGMVGCLTGITRSPFTCSILVSEMTNSHNVIFYLMLTALVSNLIANMVSRHSFYDYLKDGYIDEIHKSERQNTTVTNS